MNLVCEPRWNDRSSCYSRKRRRAHVSLTSFPSKDLLRTKSVLPLKRLKGSSEGNRLFGTCVSLPASSISFWVLSSFFTVGTRFAFALLSILYFNNSATCKKPEKRKRIRRKRMLPSHPSFVSTNTNIQSMRVTSGIYILESSKT